MYPVLSIIIPCYKTEGTLRETLSSVLSQSYQNWEAIIINDGSPDDLENIALEFVDSDQRFKYLKKNNGGLATARNLGVKVSRGEYILPLDSDNLIRPDFTKKALEVFQQKKNIGVVYSDANFFGSKTGLWEVGEFSKYKLLDENYIDACAVIKKSLFDKVGGYDENLPYQGHEDWELWLKVLSTNFSFYYLREIGFDYRVSKDSMINRFSEEMMVKNIKYIKFKHSQLYVRGYSDVYYKYNKLVEQRKIGFWSRFLKRLNIK